MSLGWLGTNGQTWAGIIFLFIFSAWIYLGWYVYFSGKTAGILYALIAAQISFIGQVLGAMLVLGWLGILLPIPLIAACGLVSTAVYVFGVRPQWKQSLDRNRAFFAWVRKIRIPFWVVLLGLLMAVILIRNLFWGWFLPPFLRDDIAYHLTIMGNIVQSGAIHYFPSPSEWIRDYPINSELFQAWNFMFLGSDKLVDLAFLPTVVVGGLALYGICRRFGFSRRSSVAGWAVFALTPLVFLEQLGSYNDAWMAALFLCGVYVILAQPIRRAGNRGPVLLAGICSGVMLGTKFSGALCSFTIGCLMVFSLLRSPASGEPSEKNRSRHRYSIVLYPVLIFILLTAFFGAYPLIRNAIVEGNPLAPVEVKIGDWTIWEGRSASEFPSIGSEEVLQLAKTGWDRINLIWFEKYRLIFDSNNGGTGPIWLFLGVPGAILWVWAAFRKRNGPAIGIAILSLMILLLTPAQWRPRYVLPLLLISGLGGALLMESLRSWPRRIAIALLVLSAAFVTLVTLRPSPLEPEKVMALVFQSDDRERNAGYVHNTNEFFSWVEDRTWDAPAVIVYGRWVDAYPLFGSDLRNTVFSLAAYSADAWDRELEASGAEMVVTAIGSPEEKWTLDSGDFVEVFRYEPWVVWERK